MLRMSVRKKCFIVAVLILMATALIPLSLHAQSSFGSIVGTVTDPSGAVVPDATVTITDNATAERRTVQTNANGEYSFVSLVPSSYKVDVEKTGFKRYQRDVVTVEINATSRVAASLAVGVQTETVEVTTETPQLQTDSGTMSTVIEGKTIDEMPLNGRNTMNLIALAPGVVPTNNTAGGAALGTGGHTSDSNWSAYSIGGGLVGQSTMYLDGMPLNVLGGGGSGTIEFVPTQDAIQEFSVATNADTSEFGRYSGGVVNMGTKSGTNTFHGTIYEYFRNNVLNANEFFNKQTELAAGKANKPAQYNQNQYGAAIGGPIKRDKIFGFFSWEEFTARESSLQTRAVPTQDMSNGILDFMSTNLTPAQNMMNAASSAAAINTLKPQCNAKVVSGGLAVQLNGGVINAASGCLDPAALVMMTEWPTPNAASTQNNSQRLSGFGSDTANYIGRVDYSVSQKQRVFARFVDAKLQDLGQEWMPGGVMPSGQPWHIGGGTTVNRAVAGVLGDTYTINPSTIVDLRFSVSRDYNAQIPTAIGKVPLSIFGANWAALSNSETVPNIPQLNFVDSCTGYICTPTSFANAGQLSYQWNDNTALVFSLTKLVGKHNLKMGGETRFMDRYLRALQGGNVAGGTFTFQASYFTQSAWGNFLLGTPDSATINTTREVGSYNLYQGYYINDTWQATPKLTVNVGIRYELPGNIREKHDNAIELQPSATDQASYPGFSIPGSVSLVNSAAYADRGSQPARHDLFAPNLGAAFRLSDHDVIRGAYGYSIAPIDISAGIFPETFSLNANTTTWNYATTGTSYALANPYPTAFYPGGLNQPISRAAFTPKAFVMSNVNAPVATLTVPTTQQWNLVVAHQFGGNMSLDVGYAGSSAKGLPISTANGYNYNELPSTYWNDTSVPIQVSNASSTTLVSAAQLALCKGVWGTGVRYGQCARPYSSYQTYADAYGPYGFITYESLPVRLQKRFKAGGLINASYTWSKTLGNTGGGGNIQDWDNLRGEKSVTSYNIPRRLVISSVLPLPFGHGQLYLQSLGNSLADKLVSGWSVNAITTFQDGFPLAFTQSLAAGTANIPNQFGAGLRPNYQFGCPRMAGGSYVAHVLAGTSVLNNCWSAPPLSYALYNNAVVPIGTLKSTAYSTTLGNETRNDDFAKAPGQNNWDVTLQKRTGITERVNTEFRVEMFNVFNQVRFGAPTTAVNGNGFGTITGNSQGENQPRLIQLSLRASF